MDNAFRMLSDLVSNWLVLSLVS